MYKKGDKIVYPMHGVGVIEAIEKKEVLGKRAEFYIITILNNNMKVMIPVKKLKKSAFAVLSAKMRLKRFLIC
jgi:CarD family transcriptional regulator